jgi:hypothetical protein
VTAEAALRSGLLDAVGFFMVVCSLAVRLAVCMASGEA